MIEWSRYRACPYCLADLGEPCMSLTGRRADGVHVAQVAPQPHGNRELRRAKGTTRA